MNYCSLQFKWCWLYHVNSLILVCCFLLSPRLSRLVLSKCTPPFPVALAFAHNSCAVHPLLAVISLQQYWQWIHWIVGQKHFLICYNLIYLVSYLRCLLIFEFPNPPPL